MFFVHQFGLFVSVRLDKIQSLVLELRGYLLLWQQRVAFDVEGRNVGGCFAVQLFGEQRHDDPVVGAGHKFGAGEAMRRLVVANLVNTMISIIIFLGSV